MSRPPVITGCYIYVTERRRRQAAGNGERWQPASAGTGRKPGHAASALVEHSKPGQAKTTGKPGAITSDSAVEKDRISIRNPARKNPAHKISDTLLIDPKVRDQARRAALIAAAGRDEDPDPDIACLARVIEYDVPGRGSGERITLVTTITSPAQATAADLAAAYHQRWEHETGNAQLKTTCAAPAGSCDHAAPTWSARKSTATS